MRSLFKELGGSEETWVEWSKPQPWPDDKPHPPRGVAMLAWGLLFYYLLRLDRRIKELEKR